MPANVLSARRIRVSCVLCSLFAMPLNGLFCWMFPGLVAHDIDMRSLERLATKVLPRLGLSLEG